MNTLKLGIVGISDGNGHPYSWSAIFNGYSPDKMMHSGFPIISEYLAKQVFPRDTIKTANVTHVWSQDIAISKKISEASFIPSVAKDFYELVDAVDAVLLARDDCENHWTFASYVLQTGIPIFIDKPLALTLHDAKRLLNAQQYEGQIFSCSSLRFSRSLKLSREQADLLGPLKLIKATVPKSWKLYAVHGIEAIRGVLGYELQVVSYSTSTISDRTCVRALLDNGIEIRVQNMGATSTPIILEYFGRKNSLALKFSDTFNSFKSALQLFVDGAMFKEAKLSSDDMLRTVRLIEMGIE